ncbi:MAG: choline/ethanolamine kinase family protein [Woeseiaceae bacterium]
MSALLSPQDALALVPFIDAGEVSVIELKGGLTNRAYQVGSGKDQFVLRLDAEHTRYFNLDRVSEIAILRSAASAGIAPELVYSDTERGILLCRYLPGKVWSTGHLQDPGNFAALCDLLRRVHTLPLSGIRFDAAAVAKRYVGNLENRQGLHAFAMRCADVIASVPPSDVVAVCHNDVVAQNVISTPGLRLLDWEYACDNDPLFDLASLVGYHNLDEHRAQALLDANAGGADAALRERLAGQVRVYDAIQWLWLANRHRLSPNGEQAARLEVLQQRIG